MPFPRSVGRASVTSLALVLLAGSVGPLATASSASDGAATVLRASSTSAHAGRRETRARHALIRAQRALGAGTGAGRRPDATLALRRLWMLKGSLSPDDRAVAEELGERPIKPAEVGDEHILVHYDPTELTTYTIDEALASLTYVANSYAASGYRRPLGDGSLGGDARTDIYLDQLEPGLYGYCTTDDRPGKGRGHDVWAFCVLDADYVGFPANTPLQNLQVTAAHEYYHATQFAYDIYEDPWLLEATAVWAEDQLYPDINDNVQYLADSPITRPGRSIDKFDNNGGFHYGVWNFFRYLSEKYATLKGSMPALLLKIWQAADSSKGPRQDKYSTQAINHALKKVNRKTSLAEEFALYSAATRTPSSFVEGVALGYPTKPLAGGVPLGPAQRQTFRTRLDHLSSSTYQLVPSGTAPGAKVKVRIGMGPKTTGSRATVVVYGPPGVGGILDTDIVNVNTHGVGKKKFDFDAAVVSAVEVTLVNGSQRVRRCTSPPRSPYLCGGRPVDQRLLAVLRVKV